MKHFKTLVFLLPFSLLLAATSCSNEELINGPDGTQEGKLHEVEVIFNIGARSSLQIRSTKSLARIEDDELKKCVFIPDGTLIPQSEPPRQLISSNDWQQVNDVRIYVFKKNDAGKFVYYTPENKEGTEQNYFSVDAFNEKFTRVSPYAVWWGGTGDTEEQHSYFIKPMLPDGEYKFLAVGRDDKLIADEDKILTDPNKNDDITGLTGWEKGSTELENATLIGANNAEIHATELFSGCTTESIVVSESMKNFSKSIALNRAVAGLLCYVENVPAKLIAAETFTIGRNQVVKGKEYNVSGIEIIPAIASDRVRLFDRKVEGNTLANNNENRCVNRFFYADIPNSAEVKNGYYVNTAPENTAYPNSLLAGRFIMPHLSNDKSDEYDDSSTDKLRKSLYLVFYTSDVANMDRTPIQWIPIRLNSSTPNNESNDPYYYEIKANQFYSLGKKEFSPDGTELNPDNDIPINLKKHFEGDGDDIVITVHPEWEGIINIPLE